MPCRSDYMEPTAQEIESKKVAQFLVYLQKETTHVKLDKWVEDAALNDYGNREKVHDLTALLCTYLKNMSLSELEYYVYDAHNKTARKLADWWEKHQKADEARIKKEIFDVAVKEFDVGQFTLAVAHNMKDNWRHGQTIFNTLNDMSPVIANEIRGTDIDPFYDDTKILAFYHWLYNLKKT